MNHSQTEWAVALFNRSAHPIYALFLPLDDGMDALLPLQPGYELVVRDRHQPTT